jgi:hypothetical protein
MINGTVPEGVKATLLEENLDLSTINIESWKFMNNLEGTTVKIKYSDKNGNFHSILKEVGA